MKTVHFLILVLLATRPAWGNSTKVDSLKQLLERHTTTDKAEVLWGIAYELFDTDNAQALFYAERAYHEVWKGGDSLQIVKVGTTYGQLLRRMGKLDRSIEVSSTMLPIARRHAYKKYWKMLLNSLTVAYSYKQDYVNALDFSYQSLTLREIDGDSIEIGMALLNIGVVHLSLKEFDEAEGVIRKANSIFEKHDKGIEHLIAGIANLAYIASNSGRSASAVELLNTSLRLASKSGIQGEVPQMYQSLAHCYHALGKYDSARYVAKLAVSLAKESSNPWVLFYGYYALIKVSLSLQEPTTAKLYLDTVGYVIKSAGFVQFRDDIFIPRIQVLLANGVYAEATKVFNQYVKYRDSVEIAKNFTRIRRKQISIAQRENEATIETQSATMLTQRESLARQRILIFVVSVLLVVSLTLALALFRSNRQKHEINQMLDRLVEARTLELSRHRDALQHVIDEENGRRVRAMAELLSMLGSLKGLLHLAEVDPGNPSENYLGKARGLTHQMEVVGQKYSEPTHRKPPIPVG